MDALRNRARDRGMKTAVSAEHPLTITIWPVCLTFLYSKNVPINGKGLGPRMPIFLKKPYGAYPYLRMKSRIRKQRRNPPVVAKVTLTVLLFFSEIPPGLFSFTYSLYRFCFILPVAIVSTRRCLSYWKNNPAVTSSSFNTRWSFLTSAFHFLNSIVRS